MVFMKTGDVRGKNRAPTSNLTKRNECKHGSRRKIIPNLSDSLMKTPARRVISPSRNEVVSPVSSPAIPWLGLTSRIREALAMRSFYLAGSEDLGVLWRGERIDASERRRRITVFAAQYRWKVDARADGRIARFESAPPLSPIPSELRSRNHE